MTEPLILATCDDYLGLVAALRARAAELGVGLGSDNAAEISGLPAAYLAKLMTPQQSGKRLGLVSLGPVLGLLGLKLQVVVDPDQTRRMAKRIERRNGTYVRDSVVHVQRRKSDFKEMGLKGGANSRKGMSPDKAKKLARKAAMIRHHGVTAMQQRSLQAREASLSRWRKYRDAQAERATPANSKPCT